ncbi:MAG TPA: hypothetical protein VGG28_24680 [Kofleriaceae bacterium]|jgi:hypothetical protein
MRVAVIALLVFACQRDTLRPRLQLSHGFTVTLTFSGGYPPFYDATAITSDGRVTREIHDDTRETHGSGSISPTELAALRTQLESVGFADLEDHYGDSVPDGGRLVLEVDAGSGVRYVMCSGHCNPSNAPLPLHDVVGSITAIRERIHSAAMK